MPRFYANTRSPFLPGSCHLRDPFWILLGKVARFGPVFDQVVQFPVAGIAGYEFPPAFPDSLVALVLPKEWSRAAERFTSNTGRSDLPSIA